MHINQQGTFNLPLSISFRCILISKGFLKRFKLNSGEVLYYLITSSSVYLCLNSQEEFSYSFVF